MNIERIAIDPEVARGLFAYDPDTGVLRWNTSRGTAIAGDEVGFVSSDGYRTVKFFGTKYLVHRVVWAIVHGAILSDETLDHIDGNRLNNRISNLRLVTDEQNARNSGPRKNNSSGVHGVSWKADFGRWVAQIGAGGKKLHLGCFESIEAAAAARRAAEMKHHGDYAMSRRAAQVVRQAEGEGA